MSVFDYMPHPRAMHRPGPPTHAEAAKVVHGTGMTARFNKWLAVKITNGVGTMWCAYAFAALALISLPTAIKGGTAPLISWIAQTFLQLVLLSIIIVGQNIAAQASDMRADATYQDAEAVLHEAQQIQAHLAEQDALAASHKALLDNALAVLAEVLDAVHYQPAKPPAPAANATLAAGSVVPPPT